MRERITVIVQNYLMRSGKRQRGFVQLFISKRLITGAAFALLTLFLPIFLYTTAGNQFFVVGIFYGLLSFAYAIFLIPGMYVINYIGFGRALVFSSFVSVLLYIVWYFMNEGNMWHLLPVAFVLWTIFRIFHWVPYHVDFALFTRPGERGRDVSLVLATIAFMGVIGPILAGFIIENAGYDGLFAVAIAFLMAATISYLFVPDPGARFEWGIAETWRHLFSKENRPIFWGEFANGAEVGVTTIVWPIFLFEILDGDFFEVGAISTVIVGITIIVQLLVGRYLDLGKEHKERVLRVGSSLYALGWVIKIFVLSAAQVFFVGLYHNITKIFTKTPYQALLYDMSAEQGKYIDEFTVLREMSVHLGRTVALILIAGATLYISINWTFILAAVASIALNMIYHISHK